MTIPKTHFLGNSCVDVCHFLASHPAPDSKNMAHETFVTFGGCGANAAAMFQALGGNATLLTRMGEGPMRSTLEQEINALGITIVDVTSYSPQNVKTSTILIEGDNRTIVFQSENMRPFSLPDDFGKHLAPADNILIESFDISQFNAFHNWLKAQPGEKILDGDGLGDNAPLYLANCDTAICSETFLQDASLTDLQDLGPKRVARTRGSKSILWREGETEGEIPILRTEVLNTLGAGDMLHGAYCYYKGLGMSFPQALQKASEQASEACTHKHFTLFLKSK